MTAVMRATAVATGPKVLRIGLLDSGRILEERIITKRGSVTVGAGEKCTFVLEANVADFKLFERVGDDYWLQWTAGMTGRVALATGVTELAALEGTTKRVGSLYRVRLTEEARGKVVLGTTTFLFQFVAPPPPQARPQLPLSVKGGLASQIDWSLTVIAAFSFLGHFAAVGGMYSDWMDPIVDQDITVTMTQLVRESGPLPVPEVAQPETPRTVASDGSPAPAPAPGPVARPTHEAPTPFVPNVRDVMGQIDRIGMGTLIALNSKGPAIDSAMDPHKPTIDLTPTGDSGLPFGPSIALPTGDGPVHIHPGAPAPLATAQTGPEGLDRAGPVRRIEVTISSDPPVTTLPIPVANLEAIIRKEVFPRARRCYQHGLESDQNQHGKIIITMKVDTSGMVTVATVAQNTGLSGEVAKCIVDATKAPNFGPNPGGTLQVPFNFVRQ
jgi:hypothetical protein